MPTIHGLKFTLDDEFRMRNRRQTDAERSNLGILIEMEGCKSDALTVAQIGSELILCDGYTTLGICEEKGIKPTAPRILPFPDRQSVLEWIDRVAEGRRNMTESEIESKAEARRQRISGAKVAGKSTRAIAAEEGISQTQVMNDLAKSGEQWCSVDTTPTPATVTGIDGKQHPATKPPTLFCRECRLRGPKKGCAECRDKRQKAGMRGGSKGKGKPPKIGSEKFDWKSYESHLGFVARGPNGIKAAYAVEGNSDEFYKCEELLREFCKTWKNWKRRITHCKD